MRIFICCLPNLSRRQRIHHPIALLIKVRPRRICIDGWRTPLDFLLDLLLNILNLNPAFLISLLSILVIRLPTALEIINS